MSLKDISSADHYQRFQAMLYDICVIIICILWPAASLLQGSVPFDKRAVTALVIFWVAYQWASQRFTGASLGQRLAGYKILATKTGRPQFFLRVIYGYVALFFSSPTMIFTPQNTDNVYWWDRKTHTRAVKTRD